jgi:RND family efflux transporter MFP subunit
VEDVAVTSIPRARRAAGLLLLALAAGGAGGCSGEPARAEASRAPRPAVPPPAAVGTPVEEITLDAPLSLPAQLYVERDAVIAARSAGTVDELLSDLGARVAAGQSLARIESAAQEIAAARADLAFENAERLAWRARQMVRHGGVTAADSEQVEFQYRQADLGRREARRDLELTRVVAPFAGVVTARYVRPRALVAAGDSLFRITEQSPLLARVRVPEAYADVIRVGDAATVVGVRGGFIPASVLRAAPAIDAGSGTREVVLRLASGARLLPGASVVVHLGAERRSAVVVPREAVGDDGYALVLEGGRTTVRPVTLGADAGEGRVEVVSGLVPGERVVRAERAHTPVSALP